MGAALGPGSPLGSLFTDLSAEMPLGWQIVDGAARCLALALKTPDLQKTPQVAAVIASHLKGMRTLISHYMAGKSGAPTGMVEESGSGGGPATDSDGSEGSDSEPAAGDAGSSDSESIGQ